MNVPQEIEPLEAQFAAVEQDARALVTGLNEALGGWRAAPDSWSVAECLDHLAVSNRVYLAAMEEPARRAREQGLRGQGAARPGLIGRLFVRALEPPVRRAMRVKTTANIRPRTAPPLQDAWTQFMATHQAVRQFARDTADLDLLRIRFPNPLIRGIRFSLATGLHVLPAHERRHLWQAWNARRAAERTLGRSR